MKIKILYCAFLMSLILSGCSQKNVQLLQDGVSSETADSETADSGTTNSETADSGTTNSETADPGTTNSETDDSANSEVAESETAGSNGTYSGSDEVVSYNEKMAVYVCGAVKDPGVYYFAEYAIVNDALIAAGGFAEDADTSYINLAEEIFAGEKLYFPTKKEVEDGYTSDDIAGNDTTSDNNASNASNASNDTTSDNNASNASNDTTSDDSGKIDINSATKDELMTLPGVGESKAEAIISYRETNGNFQTIDELMNVNGIKEGVYNNIKDMIVVG